MLYNFQYAIAIVLSIPCNVTVNFFCSRFRDSKRNFDSLTQIALLVLHFDNSFQCTIAQSNTCIFFIKLNLHFREVRHINLTIVIAVVSIQKNSGLKQFGCYIDSVFFYWFAIFIQLIPNQFHIVCEVCHIIIPYQTVTGCRSNFCKVRSKVCNDELVSNLLSGRVCVSSNCVMSLFC